MIGAGKFLRMASEFNKIDKKWKCYTYYTCGSTRKLLRVEIKRDIETYFLIRGDRRTGLTDEQIKKCCCVLEMCQTVAMKESLESYSNTVQAFKTIVERAMQEETIDALMEYQTHFIYNALSY